MQDRIKPQCVNHHQAQIICLQQGCTQPALLCNRENQECKKKHGDCVINMGVEKVIYKLLEMGKIAEARDDEIIGTYDKIIKYVTIQRDEYFALMDKVELRLEGDQRRLFLLLQEEEKRKAVLPSFVSKTLRGLVKPSQQRIYQEKQKLVVELNKSINLVNKQLQVIKKLGRKDNQLTPTQQPIPQIKKVTYLFDSQLCNTKCMLVQKQNKIIKMIKKSEDKQTKYALISPFLQLSKDLSQTVRLKINKINKYVSIGMCYKQMILNNGFSILNDTKPNHGGYLCRNNGWTNSSTDNAQNNSWSNMLFSEGEILELTFRPQIMKLFFKNVNRNTETSLNFKFNQNDQLCFCVGANKQDNEIEILT